MKIRALTSTGTILALTACGSPSSPAASDEPLPVVRLRQEPFSLTYASGLTQPQRLLIRDQAAWQQAWAAIWRGHSSQPAVPEVDFSREMIVLAALGERPTGGYGIFIDAASARSGGIAVRIRSVSPGNACGVTQALTQPVDVARLPRRTGEAVYTEVQETQDCR